MRLRPIRSPDDTVVVVGGRGSEIGGLDPGYQILAFPVYDDNCRTSAVTVAIDIAVGTRHDADCPARLFVDAFSGQVNLSYHNWCYGRGHVSTPDRWSRTRGPGLLIPDDEASPYKAGAVFEATIEVTYDGGRCHVWHIPRGRR